MNDELTALLQALTVALSALIATHPEPERLRTAFDALATKSAHQHPTYQATIDTLSKALTKT